MAPWFASKIPNNSPKFPLLWKGCRKTNVFKLFGLITLLWYHLSRVILSILLGYSKLYCKSNYTYPQGRKYIRTLLCNPLNKRHYSFLQSTYQNCYYTVIYISHPWISRYKFHQGTWMCCTFSIPSTAPRWSINVQWTNEWGEWMNGQRDNWHLQTFMLVMLILCRKLTSIL